MSEYIIKLFKIASMSRYGNYNFSVCLDGWQWREWYGVTSLNLSKLCLGVILREEMEWLIKKDKVSLPYHSKPPFFYPPNWGSRDESTTFLFFSIIKLWNIQTREWLILLHFIPCLLLLFHISHFLSSFVKLPNIALRIRKDPSQYLFIFFLSIRLLPTHGDWHNLWYWNINITTWAFNSAWRGKHIQILI